MLHKDLIAVKSESRKEPTRYVGRNPISLVEKLPVHKATYMLYHANAYRFFKNIFSAVHTRWRSWLRH